MNTQTLVIWNIHGLSSREPMIDLSIVYSQDFRLLRMTPCCFTSRTQIQLGHEIGIDIAIHKRTILIWTCHAINTKLSRRAIVAQREPETRRLNEQFKPNLLFKSGIISGFNVLDNGKCDICIDMHCRGAGWPVSRTFFATDRAPGKSSPMQ